MLTASCQKVCVQKPLRQLRSRYRQEPSAHVIAASSRKPLPSKVRAFPQSTSLGFMNTTSPAKPIAAPIRCERLSRSTPSNTPIGIAQSEKV